MEIKHITPKLKQNNSQLKQNKNGNKGHFAAPAFTGSASALLAAPSTFLRFLDTNQGWGANLVDLGSMVIPRTYYDTKHRGIATGLETGRRESTGTFNHAMVGVYGTAAGAVFAMGLNNTYKFKSHKIFANNETLNILGNHWFKALQTNREKPLDTYLNEVISNTKIYNPSHKNATEGYVSISQDTRQKVVDKLKDLILNGKQETVSNTDTNYLKALITADTGGERNVLLKGFYNGKRIQADNTLEVLIKNIHNVTKAFNKKGVIDNFLDAIDNGKSIADVEVLKKLKNLNIKRSVAGLAFASAFGMSVQPINMYLTKKKTGCDGFPGVPGRKKDKSKKFLALKSVMAASFATGAISTIMFGDKNSALKKAGKILTKTEKLQEFGKRFLAKIQFKGAMPTINQLKFVYGMTIMSRLLCARDKDELRESAVKDSLGFLNLLVLGSLVTKGVTGLLDKSLINLPKNAGKGFFSWMKNSSAKSRDEVLLETLKSHGLNVVENGKVLPYGKLLAEVKKLPQTAKSTVKKQLVMLNIAQLAGYAYSGIFLGYYLPKINDKMSKANEAKRIARIAKAEGKTIEQVKAEMAEEIKKMEAQASGKKQKQKNTSSKLPSRPAINNALQEFKSKTQIQPG